MKRDYTRLTLEFYRQVSGDSTARVLSDIPADALVFIGPMEFSDLAKPVVVQAMRQGVPATKLADLYGLHPTQVYRWRDRYLPKPQSGAG